MPKSKKSPEETIENKIDFTNILLQDLVKEVIKLRQQVKALNAQIVDEIGRRKSQKNSN